MQALGNRTEDSIVNFKWDTNAVAGESITRATNGTVSVYKNDDTTQSTAGVTDTEDFDTTTGIHNCKIDTSADAFYAVGADYQVVLSGASIDGKTINSVLASFTIEYGFAEVDVVKWLGTAVATPTVAGVPEVDVTHFGGSAGSFSAGVPGVNTIQLSGDSAAADSAEAIFDGTGANVEINNLLVNGTSTFTGVVTYSDFVNYNANVRFNEGIFVSGGAANADAIVIAATLGGKGLSIEGEGAGAAVYIEGGATGNGIEVYGGATSGDGMWIGGQGAGVGLSVFGGTTGNAFDLSVTSGVEFNTEFARRLLDMTEEGINSPTQYRFTGTALELVYNTTIKLESMIETDDNSPGEYRFDVLSLQLAPTGGSAPSAGDIADAVWDEATAGHTTGGTFGEQCKTDIDDILTDTAEIGAAGAGLTSRASQASVDDVPTNSELATALAAADDAVLAALSIVAGNVITILGHVDTEIATIIAELAKVPKSDSNVTHNATALLAIADAILDRDMAAGTDSGSPTHRTLRQAVRFLRNKWAQPAGVLTIYKEDDATVSWTGSATSQAGADPIVGVDPAGP